MFNFKSLNENVQQRILLSLIGALQGTLFYLIIEQGESYLGEWVAISLLFFVGLVSGLYALCIYKMTWGLDLGFSAGIGAIGAGLFALASYLIGDGSVPEIFYFAIAVSTGLLFFVPLAFYQTARDYGRGFFARGAYAYRGLFLNAWTNKLVLLIAGLFLGAGWIIIALWSGLFDLIGVSFFEELFFNPAFAYIFSGTILGLGISIAREKPYIIQSLLQILLTLFKFLTPVLGAVGLLFVLALPFTGLEKLWNTGFATALLLSLLFAFLLAENAVVQAGEESKAYPSVINVLVMVTNLILPVFAFLAGYALYLRVGQYGWTPDRIYMSLISLVGLLYGINYSAAVIVKRRQWVQGITAVNLPMAIFVVGLGLVMHLPPLQAYKLSAGDQLARLKDGRIKVEDFDFPYLKFKLGQAGRNVLADIENDQTLMVDPLIKDQMEQTAELGYYSQHYPNTDKKPVGLERVETYVEVFPINSILPQAPIDLWLRDTPGDFISCYKQASDKEPVCGLILTDLNEDGLEDIVFMNIWLNMSSFLQESPGKWVQGPDLFVGTEATADLIGTHREILNSLRAGRFQPTAPEVKNLTIGDITFKVR